MSELTTRDLFLNIINFKHSNRTIKWEFGYWGGTINRWYKEGLPQTKNFPKLLTFGEPVPGSGVPWGAVIDGAIQPRDEVINNYFNLDSGVELIPFNYWIYPPFEKDIINEDSKSIELYDVDGIKKRILKDNSSMPMWLEFPVKDNSSWEKIKEERFNLNDIHSRYTANDNTIKYIKNNKERTFPLGIFYYPIGFFGSIRYLLGEEKLFISYYDNPHLIKEICEHLYNLWISISEDLISKIDIDIVFFWEDMSGRNGSLISPSTFKEFMTLYYKKLVGFFKAKGVKHFAVDTDGKVDELIPLFIDAGINAMFPFEQQADNDLIKIRNKYPDLVIFGGIDKNAVRKGKIFIDKELKKAESLIRLGGYIPFIDHLTPPDCSWENFKYYRNKLNKIIDNTEVL
ncbi:MAG: hypothetical protein FJW69_03355 [Actinobacteria bacterium]|nr:hypothetical protein [Actinomycetota bacterium]MBM3712380.1 hypothetical protein [Actinomycetota bacterium]